MINSYFIHRILTPILFVFIPLILGIFFIVQSQSKYLTYVGYILHVWAILNLIALHKMIFFLRKVEIRPSGLCFKSETIKWSDIYDLTIPWSRWYINVRYSVDDIDRHVIIVNPHAFKDMFRTEYGTEYFDKLYKIWKENRD